ncbi:MAG TPA: hypothetical protein VHB30_13905 [Solirubrobacteraceae bacterium]|nr:hypothetical protein [Solirubrobacteraceae bacterium]
MRAVNLIPLEEQRRSRGFASTELSPATSALILGLLVAVVAVVAVLLLDNRIDDRRSDAAQVRAQAQSVSARAQTLAGEGTSLAKGQSTATAVRSLARERYDWPGLFARISGVLPADVKLSTLNGTIAGADAATAATGAPTSGSSLQLAGCAGSLRSLATAMQRMRALDGIDDVVLGSTTRGDASSGTCPGPESFNLSVSLAGGSPAAAAATTTTTGGAP